MDFESEIRLGFLIDEIDDSSSLFPCDSSSFQAGESSNFVSDSVSGDIAVGNSSAPAYFESRTSEGLVDAPIETEAGNICNVQREAELSAVNRYLPPEFFSPGGTRKIWIPEDVEDVKPKLYEKFADIELGIAMYKHYASRSGFDVRKGSSKSSTSGVVTHKYLLCNREGVSQTVYVDTTDDKNDKVQRKSNIKRQDCPAHVKFRKLKDSGFYEIYSFEEKHNHPMVIKEHSHFLRANRQLGFSEKTFIEKMGRLNIGPTKAYKLYQELNGDLNFDGGTVIDFKNQSRKVNCFLGQNDSQMLVNKYFKKMSKDPNLTFDFICDKGKMKSLFWADEASKANFREFGDVVSFDATFRTNKYRMVFVPFTGIDNHFKSVTFGIGLLSSETIESYIWLLKTFLSAFGKQPIVIVTDEDAALKNAIDVVFPESRHRLCMWHISQKVPVRVCSEISNDTEFKKRFNKLIWNSTIDATEFDLRWNSLIEDYKLQENSWLNRMFGKREEWVAAYFKDIPLSGLMRTTSRSESANSAFNKISHWGNTLVQFFRSFESSMDRQRHNQSFLDHRSNTSKIKSKISLKIMDHAASVYTNEVFKKVNHEIEESMFSCSQHSFTSDQLVDRFVVMQTKLDSKETVNSEDVASVCEFAVPESAFFFKVTYDKKESSFECSCCLFLHYGILCRHIFCIFRTYHINKIPSKYILRRWSKGVIDSELLMKRCLDDDDSSSSHSTLPISASYQVMKFVKDSLSSFEKNEAKVMQFFDLIKEAKLKVEGPTSSSSSSYFTFQKEQVFSDFVESSYGVAKPSTTVIENPSKDISNKGCGTGKRLKGAKEKAITESLKQKRFCSKCKLYVIGHNKRSCDRVQRQAKEMDAARKGKNKDIA